MAERRLLAASSALVLSFVTGVVAAAQPVSNSLAPGIAPYTPAPAHVAASKAGPASPKATASAGPQASLSQDRGRGSYDYVLGPGDKLRITVFGEDGLTGEFLVAGNGNISFPLIGVIPAAGKTVNVVQDEITSGLKDGYLNDPRVSAEVITFRPYYILGEVTKPGEYPYSNGMTVMNAVATAGGFTYRANQKYVYIKKANEDVDHKVRLTDAVRLEPGETARIVERYF